MVHKHNTVGEGNSPRPLSTLMYNEKGRKGDFTFLPCLKGQNQFHSFRPPPRALVKQATYFILTIVLGDTGIGLVPTITGRCKRFGKVQRGLGHKMGQMTSEACDWWELF